MWKTAILRPLGLATVLAVGFGVVYIIAAFWGYAIWESWRPQPQTCEEVRVLANGAAVVHHTGDGRKRYYAVKAIAPTVGSRGAHALRPVIDGTPLAIAPNEQWAEGAALEIPEIREQAWLMFPLPVHSRVAGFSDYDSAPTNWYFIHDGTQSGQGYFVGYDQKSNLRVGFIGQDGFRTEMPPREAWFPVDGVKMASWQAKNVFFPASAGIQGESGPTACDDMPCWVVHMLAGDRFLRIDLRSRTVRTLIDRTTLVSLGQITPALPTGTKEAAPPASRPHHLAVRTAERVLVFDGAGKQVDSFVIPPYLRKRWFQFYELGGQRALFNSTHGVPDGSQRTDLFWTDPTGKVRRQEELALAGVSEPQNERKQLLYMAYLIPSPAAWAVFGAWVEEYREDRVRRNHWNELRRLFLIIWPALAVVCGLAAVLAVYCGWRQRRFAQPWTVVWMIFVFLGGPAGLVGYLFHRRWPVLETCPHCGRLAARDREACCRCGTEFPAPAPKGIEVFA